MSVTFAGVTVAGVPAVDGTAKSAFLLLVSARQLLASLLMLATLLLLLGIPHFAGVIPAVVDLTAVTDNMSAYVYARFC